MEVEEIQTQGSKFPRIGLNNNNNNSRVGCNFPNLEGPNNEEDETKRASLAISSDFAPGRFCGWPASRIVRVSRASGGKDRHSKVWTSKGLRDRRVRLSVHTAIQFYDLQDRLGYDQPSKAVEWLLKAAASSIDELPSINTSFPLPDTPTGVSVSGEVEIGSELSQLQHSSNSETSKGSGGGGGGPLSGSRSENRVKARERAKERRAEKEKERESVAPGHRQLLSQSSFTELLTGDGHRHWGGSANASTNSNTQQMDYFSMGQYNSQIQHQQQQQQLQQFSLLHDHMTAADLSFTMSSSSSAAGNMNRGTLQSNSPHSLLLPHHHHYGSGVPFFIGTAAGPTTADHHNNHNHNHHNHNHNNQFPAGLQLCYGDDNGRHLDHKGKGKN